MCKPKCKCSTLRSKLADTKAALKVAEREQQLRERAARRAERAEQNRAEREQLKAERAVERAAAKQEAAEAKLYSLTCGYCNEQYDARTSRQPCFCSDACAENYDVDRKHRAARAMVELAAHADVVIDIEAFLGLPVRRQLAA